MPVLRHGRSEHCARRARRPGRGRATVRSRLGLLVLLLCAACGQSSQPALGCAAALPGHPALSLDYEQAQNAATIAAVGHRLGLPDHAVTIALATALQESRLHNLQYGDRDSLGLFQQRPSQGWGRPDQILVPRFAAAAFFRRLRVVPGWSELPVASAAQAVQHSAQASAYAQWEDQARLLARAFTGEVPAGVRCTVSPPRTPLDVQRVQAQSVLDLGPGGLQPRTEQAMWRAAAWLVAHASSLQLRSVGVGDQVWTARTGKWMTTAPAGLPLRYS